MPIYLYFIYIVRTAMTSNKALSCLSQTVCMFLEESTMGREGLRLMFSSLLCKITITLPDIMKEEARDGAMCYQAVKVSIPKPAIVFIFGQFGFMQRQLCIFGCFPGVSASVPAASRASGASGLFGSERQPSYEGDSGIPYEYYLRRGECFCY